MLVIIQITIITLSSIQNVFQKDTMSCGKKKIGRKFRQVNRGINKWMKGWMNEQINGLTMNEWMNE